MLECHCGKDGHALHSVNCPIHGKKKSKYRSVKTEVDGITFASKREAKRYSELKLLERAKQISGLTLQPRYLLEVNAHKVCTYVGDFAYVDPRGAKLVCEDAKGMRTKDYAIKRKLFLALYPHIEHREV